MEETKSSADAAQTLIESPLSVSYGTVCVGDKTLSYTAAAGYLPIKDQAADGAINALLFHTYYTLDGVEDRSKRP